MSIIDPNTEVEVADVVKKIKLSNLVLYKKILQAVNDGFSIIWGNKNFTAQEIFDAFGTEAKDLFILSSDLQTLLAKANPSFEPMIPPHPYTINQDGTVTVNETP